MYSLKASIVEEKWVLIEENQIHNLFLFVYDFPVMDERIFLIINPNASKGRGEKSINLIKACFEKEGKAVDVFITGKAGDAEDAAGKACREGYGTLVCAGGDGAVNETVNGILKSGCDVNFGIIPIGRGNDFAWVAGIPKDIASAVDLIVKGEPVRIDAGYLEGGIYPEGHYFLNGTGFGFEPSINFKAAEYRHLNGMPSYIVAFFHCLLHLPISYDLKVRVDDEVFPLKSQQVSVCNGRRMGSAFILAPYASLDDGLLDIVYSCRPVTRREVIPMVLCFFKGTQLEKCRFMKMKRGREVEITSGQDNLVIHTDGEFVSRTASRCLVRVIPSAVRLHCLKKGAQKNALK